MEASSHPESIPVEYGGGEEREEKQAEEYTCSANDRHAHEVASKGWSVTLVSNPGIQKAAVGSQLLSPKSGAMDTLRRLSIKASSTTTTTLDDHHHQPKDEALLRKHLMGDIRGLMETIWQKAAHTMDVDMLGVLKDELDNLTSAFTTLS